VAGASIAPAVSLRIHRRTFVTGLGAIFAAPLASEAQQAVRMQRSRLAILWDASAADQRRAAESSARSLGMSVQSLEIRNPSDDFSVAFAEAARLRTEALLVVVTAVFFRQRAQIAQLALNYQLPTVFAVREFVEAGGLMSYGANLSEMFRRAAIYVDKILKGAKPSDLPIEQPATFELVVNLKTAKTLGLTIPPSLLLRADQIIE
jgi:putative ABC transport system substrate-binding protein